MLMRSPWRHLIAAVWLFAAGASALCAIAPDPPTVLRAVFLVLCVIGLIALVRAEMSGVRQAGSKLTEQGVLKARSVDVGNLLRVEAVTTDSKFLFDVITPVLVFHGGARIPLHTQSGYAPPWRKGNSRVARVAQKIEGWTHTH